MWVLLGTFSQQSWDLTQLDDDCFTSKTNIRPLIVASTYVTVVTLVTQRQFSRSSNIINNNTWTKTHKSNSRLQKSSSKNRNWCWTVVDDLLGCDPRPQVYYVAVNSGKGTPNGCVKATAHILDCGGVDGTDDAGGNLRVGYCAGFCGFTGQPLFYMK